MTMADETHALLRAVIPWTVVPTGVGARIDDANNRVVAYLVEAIERAEIRPRRLLMAYQKGRDIVAAVNAHDELLAALREMLSLPCMNADDMDIIELSVRERARAAIARAEGKANG